MHARMLLLCIKFCIKFYVYIKESFVYSIDSVNTTLQMLDVEEGMWFEARVISQSGRNITCQWVNWPAYPLVTLPYGK